MTEVTEQSKETVVDFGALFEGTELTEETKGKITTIFEAALTAKLEEEVAKIQSEFEEKFETTLDEVKAELTDTIGVFLNYAVEEWINENRIALETGMRNDITENFIVKLKDLFLESYIDVPEEKYDVMDEMENTITELTGQMDEQIAKNITLNTKISELIKESIVTEVSTGLTATDADKFNSLIKDVVFESESSYKEKVSTIRENFFTKPGVPKPITESVSDETVKTTNATVSKYVAAWKK